MSLTDEKWGKEKFQYIEKLKKVNQTINNFLDKDIGGFIELEVKENLQKCMQKSKIFLNKLEKDIFEIAIIGQDNAGKSSFANSLISSYAFPSTFKRCTYTTTQLEYDDNNKTIVEFHTIKSFNEVFQGMLKEIDYPTFSQVYFDTLSLSNFDQHLESLRVKEPALFNYHQGNTIEDIKAMLRGAGEIKNYLDKPTKTYEGHINDEIKKFITHEYISRAVKKITIHSSELKDLKNSIIYDVPGFTSPTKIHKSQTVERLKTVDAIILIHNLQDSPNLSGPQLDVFSEGMDIDDVRLKEKLFIFGNKVDYHITLGSRNYCIDEFKKDIFKRDLAENRRIFAGSSGSFLARNGIPIDEENDPKIVEKLKSFEYDDNIENLKKILKDYYKTERFEILKRRIDSVINDVSAICSDFIKNQELHINQFDSKFFSIELAIEMINICKIYLSKELTHLRDKKIEEIKENKFLSNKLSEVIDKSFIEITDLDYKETEIFVIGDTHGTPTPEKINDRLRENLNSKFKLELEDIISDIANEKYQEFSNLLLEKFLESLELKKENQFYEDVKIYCEKFIQKITKKISYQPTSFVFLAERFTIDLFDILILHRLNSGSRKVKFDHAEQNFYTLALFHSYKLDDKPIYLHPLVKLILTQQESNNELNVDIKSIKSLLANELSKIKDVGDMVYIYDNQLLSYATQITKYGFGFGTTKYIVSKIIEKFTEEGSSKLSKEDDKDRNKTIEEIINHLPENLKANSNAKSQYFASLLESIKVADSQEKVISEINTDIKNLKSLLKDSVVSAIELETPFKSIITKQIDALKNKIIPTDSTIDKDFEDLIKYNAAKIKFDKFSNIAQQEAINENKKNIIRDMKVLVGNLNGNF